ncbi:MAG TPA: hypothetical protein PLI09_24390 [Candidatus Hydrogenedentes bacterium]|nr:hypothetical protein [Candidatus Hydrogenedentota bacterium]
MSGKNKRISTSGPATSLTSSPFAQLRSAEGFPAVADNPPPHSPQAPPKIKSAPAFRIARTKKGNYPIFLEKRAAGKTVTVIRNVSGDLDALLALLKKKCAAGGKAFEDSVEIQGDHCAKIESFLRENGI